jgi:hypothetical protein
MEFGPGQEGTGRTGGPITGWVIGYDGSFDAAENWQHVLDVDVESSSRAGEAEPLPMAVDVAMEMLNVDGHEGMAAVQAAQVLEKSFEAFDEHARQIRRQEFQERVRQEFLVAAEHLTGGGSERTVVVVENLVSRVTGAMLEATFRQVGSVIGAGKSGEDWGWVEFELEEEAMEAVMCFGGVELAGQPMVCRLQDVSGEVFGADC